MALNSNLTTISMTAGADFSAKQYRFVKQSSGTVLTAVLAVAGGSKAIGVLQNNPVAGAAAAVSTDGVSKVVAGVALAVGDNVTSNAAGAAIGTTAGDTILGKVIIAATTGAIASVLLDNSGVMA